MNTYTATAPDGSKVSRNSKKAFSHAVLTRCSDKPSEWGYLAWSSTRAGAEAAAKKWRSAAMGFGSTYLEVIVVPVDG